MSLKLKALGLGLIAALAMSAMAVVNAGAETGGHFVSDVAHTTLSGEDVSTAQTRFTAFGSEVKCADATYHGTTTTATSESVTITPTYITGKCEVPGLGEAHIDMTGCTYTFTVRKVNPGTSHNTVHLVCPAGSLGPHIVVTGPFGTCKMTVTPNQTPAGGVVYETGISNTKHDITANVTVSGIHAIISEGGFFQCGTSETTTSTATLHGKATLVGKDTNGNSVNITAT